MKVSGSIYRPALALVAALTVAVFGAGLTGCGQTPERCGSEAGGGSCTDPSDFTVTLAGSLVLEMDGWPDASKVQGRDGSGSRWEYSVTVTDVLYRSPTVDAVAPGSTTMVTPVSALGGSPSWNTATDEPVYVVAYRATGSSGPVEEGDLVVKGVFDESLNVIGSPRKTTNLQRFISWLEKNRRRYDPRSEFLVDWVRSFNEETRPDGGHPMQDRWIEYLSPGPDPERNVDPPTADPEIDGGPPIATTPSSALPTPGA